MRQLVLVLLVAASLLFAASQSHATFTTHLDPLVAELQVRSVSLSNATDKASKAQKRAADSAVRTLNRSTKSLATDITAAGAVARLLQRAFPGDFSSTTLLVLNGASPKLDSLLDNGFSGLHSDVQTQINALQEQIDALPDGKIKTAALKLLAKATNTIAGVTNDISYAAWTKALAGSLSATLAGKKVASKGGGTPGGGSSMGARIVVNGGAVDNWVASTNWGEWVQSSGIITFEGDRTTKTPNFHLTVALTSGFSGATGTYPLAASVGGILDNTSFPPTYYAVVSGTLTISALNASARTASGTFSLTASDGMSTITVSDGMFNVKNMVVTP
jgi:hypothetical protein